MSDPMVHIYNVSGSALEVATVGLVMEKGAISAEQYALSELDRSGEIKKYKQLHFIQLITPEQAEALRKPPTQPILDEVLNSPEPTNQIKQALANLRKGLDSLEVLLSGKEVPVDTSSKSDQTPEDDGIPAQPPKGMEPMNDPVKKLLGRAPYSGAASTQEQINYARTCNDPGILRELATFATDASVKNLARKKLREVSAATPTLA